MLSAALLLVPAAYPQEQSKKQQEPEKESKRSEKKLLKELASPYKKWLDQEVSYIISDEERAAFLRLSDNEEREQFIEQFWLRRDPTPDTVENEFKEEHYRRIAYVNERFSVGKPGWMTDRGRIYIIHGPPDHIDFQATGGIYHESPAEGRESVVVYPFERWHYRRLEGIGNDIVLEFVDTNSTGDYRLSLDPTEKEVFTRSGALTRGTEPLLQGEDANKRLQTLNRMDLYIKAQKPPEVRFRDLEELVTARIVRNLLSFDLRTDFIRVTDESILVPLTIAIRKSDLTFQVKSQVHQAVLNVYGRVTTLTERTVQVFEDVIQLDEPASLFASTLSDAALYQKVVPLRAGLYKLSVVVKDVNSGNLGVIRRRLAVPRFEEDKLAHSSLILADLIEPAHPKELGRGQFVIGSMKVRTMVGREFKHNQRLGIYMQIYNLGLKETAGQPDATIRYVLMRDNQTVFSQTETVAQHAHAGRQATVAKLLPLASFPPGEYVLLLICSDQILGESFQSTASFRVLR